MTGTRENDMNEPNYRDELNYNLKIDVGAINIAIRKAFAVMDKRVDDITWNPHRGGLINDRFSIHSLCVTVNHWQKTIYRIETTDIIGYSTDRKHSNIRQLIEDLVASYQHSSETGDMTPNFRPAQRYFMRAW
jgi:hypothetical protein